MVCPGSIVPRCFHRSTGPRLGEALTLEVWVLWQTGKVPEDTVRDKIFVCICIDIYIYTYV